MPRLTAEAVASAPAWRNERRSVLFEGSVDMASGSPRENLTGNVIVTSFLLTTILPRSNQVSKRCPVRHRASAWLGISARVFSMMNESRLSAARRTSALLSPSWRINP